MRIQITAKPHKHQRGVYETDKGIYEVHTNQPPADNRANEDIIRQIAEYFDVPKRSVSIVSGSTTRKKILEISI